MPALLRWEMTGIRHQIGYEALPSELHWILCARYCFCIKLEERNKRSQSYCRAR